MANNTSTKISAKEAIINAVLFYNLLFINAWKKINVPKGLVKTLQFWVNDSGAKDARVKRTSDGSPAYIWLHLNETEKTYAVQVSENCLPAFSTISAETVETLAKAGYEEIDYVAPEKTVSATATKLKAKEEEVKAAKDEIAELKAQLAKLQPAEEEMA